MKWYWYNFITPGAYVMMILVALLKLFNIVPLDAVHSFILILMASGIGIFGLLYEKKREREYHRSATSV